MKVIHSYKTPPIDGVTFVNLCLVFCRMASMQTITFNNATFTGAGTVFLCGFGNKITWRNKFSSFSSLDKAVLQSSGSGTLGRFSCSNSNPS